MSESKQLGRKPVRHFYYPPGHAKRRVNFFKKENVDLNCSLAKQQVFIYGKKYIQRWKVENKYSLQNKGNQQMKYVQIASRYRIER